MSPKFEDDEAHLVIIRGTMGAGKTSVASALLEMGFAIVEVDDIKIEKRGTTTSCIENEDFPEAGRRASRHLRCGHPIAVIEAFVNKNHLDMVFSEICRSPEDQNVSVFWLECDEETALKRHGNGFSQKTIQNQFARYSNRYKLGQYEHVIDTSKKSLEAVVQEILSVLPVPIKDSSALRGNQTPN